MDRRRFVGGVALGCVVAPLAARAQRAAKVQRVGMLGVAPIESPEATPFVESLRKGLRERGYMEGQNIIVEYRSWGGKVEQIPGIVSEFTRLKVDAIVVGPSMVARAVQQLAPTIPIVATYMGDPVEEGLAATLARPGGNVTVLTFLGSELALKRLELLGQMLPTVSRVAGLWHRDGFSERRMKELLSETEELARSMGVQLQLVESRNPNALDETFATVAREHPDALVMFPSATLYYAREHVVELAAKHRIPSMYFFREFVTIGGLASYGPSIADLARRSATYVDRILKGTKPGDLPIEQPTKFELVINLKTAKALGIAVPQSLLLRADEVIQ